MLKIKIEELQALLNYLQRKPYVETAGLIAMIQKLEPVDKKEEPVDKKEKPLILTNEVKDKKLVM